MSNKIRILKGFKKQISLQKGLSLVEVLIALSVTGFILLSFLSLYFSGQRYLINQGVSADVLANIRFPLAWIAKDVKEAIQVVQGSIAIGEDSYSSSENCLVLRVPSLSAEGMIIDIDKDFDTIIYCRKTDSPNQLLRIVDSKDGISSRSDGIRVLSEDVDTFVLSYFDSGGNSVLDYAEAAVLGVSLSARRKGIGRFLQETASTQIKLRNKPCG